MISQYRIAFCELKKQLY